MEFDVRRGSERDFDAVLGLSQELARALFDESGPRCEELRAAWDRPSFVPERHLFVAVDGGGAMVGHGSLEPGSGVAAQALPSAGEEVATALIARVEEQARAEGARRLTAVVAERDELACRAYRAAGYEAAQQVLRLQVEHEAEPAPREWPEGVGVRTYAAADADAVHALLDEAYLGWDSTYVPVSHADWLAFMTSHDSFDPECWFLAEAHGSLAGVCLCWRDGWVKDLAVRPEWRRRGLGESLLRHAFRELWGRGVRRVGLKVDSGNSTGAPRLYERVGMRVDRRYPIFTKTL